MVRQRDLAGPRRATRRRQARVGDGVVRRAERARGARAPCRGASRPPTRVDARSSRAPRRAISGGRMVGQPPREHRLARAGRPEQEHVVPAGRRDLERRFDAPPAPARRRSRSVRRGRRRTRRVGVAGVRARARARRGSRRPRRGCLTPRHVEPSTTAASAALARGHDDRRSRAVARRLRRRREDAAHGPHRAVEGEFAEHRRRRRGLLRARACPAGGEEAERRSAGRRPRPPCARRRGRG